MKLRTQLLALVCGFFTLVSLVAFALNEHFEDLRSQREVLVHRRSDLSLLASSLQLRFERQTHAWDRLLLRGHTPGDWAEQATRFDSRERETALFADELRSRLPDDAAASASVAAFIREHKLISVKYRAALDRLRGGGVGDAPAAAAMVRGIDREPTRLLRQTSKQIEEEFGAALAVIDAEGEFGTGAAVLGASVVVLIALFSLLYFIQRGVTQPTVDCIGFAERIAREDFEGDLPNTFRGELRSLRDSLVKMRDSLKVSLTRLRQTNNELTVARDEALEAARMKSEFLANMSHEIRTPMNGVIGMTELLSDTRLDAEQKLLVNNVRGAADTLLHLINDILDFSKVESGKLELEHEPFDLRATVEEALDINAGAVAEKGLELIADVGEDVHSWVKGDAGRIKQVVLNLINNAVKFTSSGEVLVRVRGGNGAGSRERIRIEVTDTGIGITPAKQRQIFESFSQADASTTREFGGTGLGLAICKALVELMGGRIGVVSELGRGSTFFFEIEFTKASATKEAADPPEEVLGGKRVLVVDDNATNRRILVEHLKRWDVSTVSAGNGEEALRVLRAEAGRFDLVLSDFQMPVMDGVSLAKEIIQLAGDAPPVRIVLLTSVGGVSVQDARQSGFFFDVALKPIKKQQLLRVVARALSSAEAPVGRDGGVAETEGVQERAGTDQSLAKRRLLVVEDNASNQRLAELTLGKTGCQFEIVDNGKAAIEAVLSGGYDAILMDCQMPIMDGFEATEIIRRRESHHNYIIALTANAISGDREKCLAAGMDDYLSKPIKPKELVAKLVAHFASRDSA